MPTPVRVLHSLSAIASGGVEARHLQIASNLGEPFEHRFLGTTGGELAETLRGRGFRVDLLGPVGSVLAPGRYRQALRVLDGWRPDLVHGAVMEGTTLGLAVAKRFRVPLLMEETSDPANRRPMGHRLVRLVAAGAKRCVAVSPAVGRYLTADLGVSASKVQVLVNGVPRPSPSTAADVQQLREQLGIGRDDPVIGTVCRLFDDHKRVTDLVAAFDALQPGPRPSHLVIVGDGRDQQLIADAAAATAAAPRIHLVGRQHPADPYYALMDIFAITSSREAFGLVAAEAMRAGLPVVATDVGGLADIVVDEVTGLLVPPRRPDRVAAALQRLVDDPALRERMGAAGRQRADEEYSVERYLAEVEALYRRLLEPRRS